jgi:hypothetical protein
MAAQMRERVRIARGQHQLEGEIMAMLIYGL